MTSATASATAATSCGKPRRSIMRWVPIILIALFVFAAVFAPLVAPYDPNSQNLLGRMRPPGTVSRSFHYLLGSDELGRDLLSRLIYGARVSLFVAIASVILSGVVGVLLGMLAGYLRGWVELIVMRLVDVFLSIPAILLAIITVAVLGTGLVNVIVVLALTRWPRYARIAYGQTLGVANMPYVRLATFMGASHAARPLPAHPAQHHRGGHCGGDARIRPDGPVRGGSVVSRSGRTATDGELGGHAQLGAKLSRHCLVDRHLPGSLPVPAGPRR